MYIYLVVIAVVTIILFVFYYRNIIDIFIDYKLNKRLIEERAEVDKDLICRLGDFVTKSNATFDMLKNVRENILLDDKTQVTYRNLLDFYNVTLEKQKKIYDTYDDICLNQSIIKLTAKKAIENNILIIEKLKILKDKVSSNINKLTDIQLKIKSSLY